MDYRPFGRRVDFRVSALGFGCMRLPVIGGKSDHVDEDLATEMLRFAVEAGVNYVDTAYPYHGGASEKWLGRALKHVPRDEVRIATKLPTWQVERYADFDTVFAEQLARLDLQCVDVYLLHNLFRRSWAKMLDLGALRWLDKLLADGRAGAVGFSFHDSLDVFKQIVDAYDWHLCQIQYNYMNEDVQAGTEGLRYAAGKGLAVAVMEPLLGGCLAEPAGAIRRVWDAAPDLSPADVALQWLWDKPEVSVVLSGMTAMQHVRRNVASAARSGVGCLSEEARSVIERVRACWQEVAVIPCTRCGYCLPCPEGVDIPYNFRVYNDAQVFGGSQQALNRALYGQMPEAARADRCVQCRQCEERCPQGIAVSEELVKVKEAFAPKKKPE